MTVTLNGRLTRLERGVAVPAESTTCSACGLPHVRLPVPVQLVEAIVRRGLEGASVEVPQLCLCGGCCSEGHAIARLTHGLPSAENTA
jgi:hypothetical protein